MNVPTTTPAIAATTSGPVEADSSFVEIELELGALGPHDLLVQVRAVSVNPVDVKVRASFEPGTAPRVLGFDAAGTVVATDRRSPPSRSVTRSTTPGPSRAPAPMPDTSSWTRGSPATSRPHWTSPRRRRCR